MSEVVTLRFVCSDGGRHKERTLLTVERWPEGPWGPAHLGTPGDPYRQTPEFVQNEVLYQASLRSLRHTDDFMPDDPRSGKPHSPPKRPLLKCPHCRPRMVFSEATMMEMAEPYERFGGTCTIDVSTGAIVHKQ